MSIDNPIASRQPAKPVSQEPDAIQSLMLRKAARTGRPTSYTPEIAAEICDEVMAGKALHVLAKERDDLPTLSTIYYWLERFPEFSENYARAQRNKAHTIAQETLDIADGADDLTWKRAQLRVTARQWLSGKLSRQDYGEGSPGQGGQNVTINMVGLADRVEERLNTLIERQSEAVIDAESSEVEG